MRSNSRPHRWTAWPPDPQHRLWPPVWGRSDQPPPLGSTDPGPDQWSGLIWQKGTNFFFYIYIYYNSYHVHLYCSSLSLNWYVTLVPFVEDLGCLANSRLSPAPPALEALGLHLSGKTKNMDHSCVIQHVKIKQQGDSSQSGSVSLFR